MNRPMFAIRVALPLALLAIGYAVLVSEQWSVTHELQLVAPEEVRPGDPIPVHAFVFGGIEHSDGGELALAQVVVELRAGETTLHRANLRPSIQSTSEINLPPVADEMSGLQLIGTARNEDGEILATSVRLIDITTSARPRPLRGRIGLALQHLDLGPVMAETADFVTPSFDVRVAGGICVPEEPCELWIDALPADRITMEDTPQASVVQRSSVDQGLIHFVIVPHGPEVAVELLASRLGQPIARRTVRLPLALATPWLSATRVASGFDVDIETHAPPGGEQLILDVFHDGLWIHTEATSPGHRLISLPDSGPGLYLLQVRADPYGGERAATRYVLVSSTLEQTHAWLDQAGVRLEDPPDIDPRMLLAGAEEEVRMLPEAVSGLEADRARVQERRHRLHVISATALGIGVLVIVVLLLRRGFGAVAEATTLMHAAGDSEAKSRRNRFRMTLSVLAIVGGVALALLAGAAILLSRAAMIEW